MAERRFPGVLASIAPVVGVRDVAARRSADCDLLFKALSPARSSYLSPAAGHPLDVALGARSTVLGGLVGTPGPPSDDVGTLAVSSRIPTDGPEGSRVGL